MRKIEQALVAAIRDGRPFNSGNTATRYIDDGTCEVLLHGNTIARIDALGLAQWTLAGWNTPTTRSRVNALARAFGWRGVFTERGQPRVTDRRGHVAHISADEWVDAQV